MSQVQVQAALGQLIGFSLPERMVANNPRGFPTQRSRPADLAERVVTLTATFAHALAAAGADGELNRRAALLQKMTTPGGPLDEARRAAHEQVLSVVEKLCPPSTSSRPVAARRPKLSLTGPSPRSSGWDRIAAEPAKAERFLGDLHQIIWDLPAALSYADTIAGLATPAPADAALGRWRDELWRFSVVAGRDQLLGCHLIARCARAVAETSEAYDAYRGVVDFLARALVDPLRMIRDAALDVSRAVQAGPGAGRPRGYGEGPGPAGVFARVADSPFQFLRVGDLWYVRFDTEAGNFPLLIGMAYVACLLARPRRHLSAAHISADYRPAAGKTRSVIDVDEVDNSDDDRPSRAGPQDVLDDQALREVRSRLAEVNAELDEARNWRDEGRTDKAEREKQGLLKELNRALGLGKRQRRLDIAPETKAQQAVRKCIVTAFHHLENGGMTRLVAHLRHHIHTGQICEYQPPPGFPPWTV
jgi:hypothetical protein